MAYVTFYKGQRSEEWVIPSVATLFVAIHGCYMWKTLFWIQRLRKICLLTEMWNRPFFFLDGISFSITYGNFWLTSFWITSVSTCAIAVSKYQQTLFLICISFLMFYGLPLDLESGLQLASKPASFLLSE